MRVAIVGAGSTYTPELVDGLLRRGADLPVSTLALFDPDERRLETVSGFVRRMAEPAGVNVEATADLVEAVSEAQFVVSQFRIGGQAARHGDELLGRRWDLIGQETTGVGGLAKGLRTIPVALQVQAAVARHAAPDAWLINFTNPAGMVTEALLAHGVGGPPRVIGVCNFSWTLRAGLAARLGVVADQVLLDCVGLNHLTWIRDVQIAGVSRFAEARRHWIEGLPREGPPPFAAQTLADSGVILNPYLQYYYETSRVLEAQQHSPTRAELVMPIEAGLLARYAEPDLVYTAELLAGRGGAYYSEAAAALMADLAADRPGFHVVNVRNGGAIPGIDPGVVVETGAHAGAAGPRPLPTAPLEPPIRGLISQVKDYELLAVEAAVCGDHRAARLALTAHPLAPDALRAGPLLDDLLATNAAHLPQFA